MFMKILMTITLVMFLNVQLNAQRRTIIVPAPQPPGVPVDGGLIALIISGGALAKKQYESQKNLK